MYTAVRLLVAWGVNILALMVADWVFSGFTIERWGPLLLRRRRLRARECVPQAAAHLHRDPADHPHVRDRVLLRQRGHPRVHRVGRARLLDRRVLDVRRRRDRDVARQRRALAAAARDRGRDGLRLRRRFATVARRGEKRMRRLVVYLLAAVVAAAAAPSTAASAPAIAYGLQDDAWIQFGPGHGRVSGSRRSQRSALRVVRVTVRWDQVEPEQGHVRLDRAGRRPRPARAGGHRARRRRCTGRRGGRTASARRTSRRPRGRLRRRSPPRSPSATRRCTSGRSGTSRTSAVGSPPPRPCST